MKGIVSMALALMLAVAAISGCAGAPKKKGEPVNVKCPACGFEFEAPAEGGE